MKDFRRFLWQRRPPCVVSKRKPLYYETFPDGGGGRNELCILRFNAPSNRTPAPPLGLHKQNPIKLSSSPSMPCDSMPCHNMPFQTNHIMRFHAMQYISMSCRVLCYPCHVIWHTMPYRHHTFPCNITCHTCYIPCLAVLAQVRGGLHTHVYISTNSSHRHKKNTHKTQNTNMSLITATQHRMKLIENRK